MPINNLLLALFLTIAVECVTAFIIGYRKKHYIYIMVLINIMTNPALNFILILLRAAGLYMHLYIWMLEIMVVFIEWSIFIYVFREKPKRMLILSAIMNSASYAAGVLVMGAG